MATCYNATFSSEVLVNIPENVNDVNDYAARKSTTPTRYICITVY